MYLRGMSIHTATNEAIRVYSISLSSLDNFLVDLLESNNVSINEKSRPT